MEPSTKVQGTSLTKGVGQLLRQGDGVAAAFKGFFWKTKIPQSPRHKGEGKYSQVLS